VYNTLLLKGYAVEVDRTSDNFNKKIRNAQLASFNFIGVIGKEEMKKESINLRKRDDAKEMGLFSIDELLKLLSTL
jgi:threonyl-tRNA synthetase